MKKLSLFLTLSLLTIIGTSTIVKAEPNPEINPVTEENSVKITEQDSVNISEEVDIESLEAEEQAEANEEKVIGDGGELTESEEPGEVSEYPEVENPEQ